MPLKINLTLQECLETFETTKPKSYQLQAITEIVTALENAKDIALSLPTGTGKTFVYLPIAIASTRKGLRVCVLVGTNLLLDQVTKKYLPYFNYDIDPFIAKGIEHSKCIITNNKADYGICNPEQRERCEVENPECHVINTNIQMEEHNFIFTNFHKFLSKSTKKGFDLVIVDDSHGFENAIEDKFLTRIPYYLLNRLYQKHDGKNEIIASFVGEFLDLFDDSFSSLQPGVITKRLPNDIILEISQIEDFEDVKEEMKVINEDDRRVLYELVYFVDCCKKSTLNLFYIQKDYYRQEDVTEAALIARKSETYQKRIIKSIFKDSRVIFASATLGNILTHSINCTARKYTPNKIQIVPSTNSTIIENWFNGLTIFETYNIPGGNGSMRAKAEIVANLLSNIPGKALLLFKSYRDQRSAQSVLRSKVNREITFIDEGLNNEEVQRLVEQADIIMASASSRLWEGIDISNLKFEIIFSLPFIRPPVHIPLNRSFPYVRRKMLIRLQQGIGRLIRNEKEKGVCIVIDERLAKHKNSTNFSEAYRKRIISIDIEKLNIEVESALEGI